MARSCVKAGKKTSTNDASALHQNPTNQLGRRKFWCHFARSCSPPLTLSIASSSRNCSSAPLVLLHWHHATLGRSSLGNEPSIALSHRVTRRLFTNYQCTTCLTHTLVSCSWRSSICQHLSKNSAPATLKVWPAKNQNGRPNGFCNLQT